MVVEYIAVHVQLGLCNRLRTLFGYRAVARALQVPLFVLWIPDNHCPGHYDECFAPLDDVEMMRDQNEWRRRCEQPNGHVFVGQRPAQAVIRDCAHMLADCKNKPVVDFCVLKLRSALQQQVEAFVAKHNKFSDVVGLHVRRTDHTNVAKRGAGRYTTDKDFDALIDGESQTTRFFLATDNAATQQRFAKKYKNRVFWLRNIQPRRRQLRQTSLHDAVLDLFLLARCQRVHGSVWSSFSETARVLSLCHS